MVLGTIIDIKKNVYCILQNVKNNKLFEDLCHKTCQQSTPRLFLGILYLFQRLESSCPQASPRRLIDG